MRAEGEGEPGGFRFHWLLLAAATVLALRFVPAFPRFYVDDPNRWAVFGYLAVAGLLFVRGWRQSGIRPHTRTLTAFLVAMPLVYLADWFRFGGTGFWLGVEIGGAVLFWSLAAAAVARSPRFLAVGIGGHAVWDLIHYGTSTYVPDWYVVACLIIDIGLAVVVVGLIRESESAARVPDLNASSPVPTSG